MTARCWLGSLAAGLVWAVLLGAGLVVYSVITEEDDA